MAGNNALAPAAQTFATNTRLLKMSLEGLSAEELHRCPGNDANPFIWIAGHVAVSRCGVLKQMGVDLAAPDWSRLFGRGTSVEDTARYPSVEEILDLWDSATESLKQRFESISGEELSAAAPRDYPVKDKSVCAAVHFLAWHESYHVGQLAMLRSWLGKGSLVG